MHELQRKSHGMTNNQDPNNVSRRAFTVSSVAAITAPGLLGCSEAESRDAAAPPEAAPSAAVTAPVATSQTKASGGWEEGTSIPAEYYFEPEHYRRDERFMADSLWLMVDHESRIPKAGDYFTFEFGLGESVIILRDEKKVVRAFHNVCRHRGSRICRNGAEPEPEGDQVTILQLKSSGNTPLIRCPYHAWTYDLQGGLTKASMMPKGFDLSKNGLLPCHLRVEGGHIFINLSQGDTPPEFDANFAPYKTFATEYGLADLQVGARHAYTIKANWKLLIENFLECYHCGPAHATLVTTHNWDYGLTDDEKAYRHNELKTWLGGQSKDWWSYEGKLNPGFVTGSLDGKPVAPLLPTRKEWSHKTTDMTTGLSTGYWQAYDDYVVVMRFTPRGPELIDCDVLWLIHPDAVEGKDFEAANLMALWETTFREDIYLVENQHRGVRSGGYRSGSLSTSVESNVADFGVWYMNTVAQA